MLTLEEMQDLVGIEYQPAYIEVASYRSFSDQGIKMICDEAFLMKECQPTCVTIEDNIIHGQVLVLGTNVDGGDFDLLTKEQVEIVKSEVRLVHRK